MTAGEPTDQRPPREVVQRALDLFGVSIAVDERASRGEESIGWRGSSPDGNRFVQVFPPWREVGELAWCDSIARAAATMAPECVHACPSIDGRVVVASSDGPVMVFPFIDGSHPDAGAMISIQAARLLARMHRGLASAWSGAARTPQRSHAPADGTTLVALDDEDLDRWERLVDAETPAVPIHGDFYAGNLLAAEGRIAGVIDWWDAELAHQEQEVAWATWEFCQNDDADDLIDDQAEAFLQAYVDAGGPSRVGRPFDPVPWIRRRLRWEGRTWFADPRSAIEDDAYYEAGLVAFQRLRTRRLPGR